MYISKSIQWLYKKSITKLYVVNWTLIDLFPGFQHQVKYWFANNDNNNILHKCPYYDHSIILHILTSSKCPCRHAFKGRLQKFSWGEGGE